MAANDKLISANALLEKVQFRVEAKGVVGATIKDMVGIAHKLIDEAPAVDAVVVVHGRWEVNECGTHECSVCHDTIPDEQAWCGANYCPYCGAKMDIGEEDT